jgi:hypothetical protein
MLTGKLLVAMTVLSCRASFSFFITGTMLHLCHNLHMQLFFKHMRNMSSQCVELFLSGKSSRKLQERVQGMCSAYMTDYMQALTLHTSLGDLKLELCALFQYAYKTVRQ